MAGYGVPRPLTGLGARRLSSATHRRNYGAVMSEQGYRVPEVCRIVGITYRQLDYWARTGLVTPVGPGRARARDPAAVLLPGPRDPAGDQEPARHGRVAAAGPQGRRAPQVDGPPAHGVTLMSDGKGVYEAHSPEAVVDLLSKGQGVFAIAVDRVWDDVEDAVCERAKAAPGGRRGRVSAEPTVPTISPRATPSGSPTPPNASSRSCSTSTRSTGTTSPRRSTSPGTTRARGAAVHAGLLPARSSTSTSRSPRSTRSSSRRRTARSAGSASATPRSAARSSTSATTCRS